MQKKMNTQDTIDNCKTSTNRTTSFAPRVLKRVIIESQNTMASADKLEYLTITVDKSTSPVERSFWTTECNKELIHRRASILSRPAIITLNWKQQSIPTRISHLWCRKSNTKLLLNEESKWITTVAWSYSYQQFFLSHHYLTCW